MVCASPHCAHVCMHTHTHTHQITIIRSFMYPVSVSIRDIEAALRNDSPEITEMHTVGPGLKKREMQPFVTT